MWRAFVHRHGWRAYALPLLVVLTVFEVLRLGQGARATPPVKVAAAAPTATARPSPCAGNTAAQLVVVSIGKQHAWMCAASAQVYTTAVTTGASALGLATPVGTWQVQDKQTNRYLVGPGYRDFVSYWVPFDGDFGFHDARWQTMAYGSPDYRSQGSHGCVHLAAAAMAWLFGWARVGATVTVQA